MMLTSYSARAQAVYSSFEGGLATDGCRCHVAQMAD